MFTLSSLTALLQILAIDISLAGDNALAVGLAAAGLPPHKRHRAVIAGIGVATLLRIVFAVFALRLLHITGLMAAGGLLLLWVAWKMYRELRHRRQVFPSPLRGRIKERGPSVGSAISHSGTLHPALLPPPLTPPHEGAGKLMPKRFTTALWQIAAADVSMSLDNVLAVAGVARDHLPILILGLGLSIVLMGIAASFIARLTQRFPWIAYGGLAIVLFTALRMMWDGGWQIIAQ